MYVCMNVYNQTHDKINGGRHVNCFAYKNTLAVAAIKTKKTRKTKIKYFVIGRI